MALLATASLAGNLLEEVLGKLAHAGQVRVGGVCLHRGELWVVREVGALVSELTTKLVDALKTANKQALQRKLGCNAQVVLGVQSVVVRNERLCVCAAKNLLENRGLNLHVTVCLHELADDGDDLGALAEYVADLGVHNEVNVALAITNLAVGEAVELLWQRTQRLGEDLQRGHCQGKLAAARTHDSAGCADDVAKVEKTQELPVLLVKVVDAAEELNLAGIVLYHDKRNLALVADGADAAGDGIDFLTSLAVLEVNIALLQLSDVSGNGGLDWVWVNAGVKQCLTASFALGALVVDGSLWGDLGCLDVLGGGCVSGGRATSDVVLYFGHVSST